MKLPITISFQKTKSGHLLAPSLLDLNKLKRELRGAALVRPEVATHRAAT